MRTFVDTSAFFAVLDRDDDFHLSAVKGWRRLLTDGDRLVTTNYVVVECCALIQRRLGMEALRAFHDDILSVVGVVWVDRSAHADSIQALFEADRRQLSLVDCSSFLVMQNLGLSRVFTFDEHFREKGFDLFAEGG